MKQCPKCNKAYSKDWMNFCLDDGSELLELNSKQSDALADTLIMEENYVEPISPNGKIKVVKRQVRKNYRSGTWDIEYPQLQGCPSEYIQSRINNFLRKEFISDLTEYKDRMNNILTPEEELAESRPFTHEISYSVTLLTNDLISINYVIYEEFDPMPHPNHYYKPLNIELASGYRYIYQDLFKLDSDYKTRIPDLISVSLHEQYKDEDPQLDAEEREEYDFLITKDGLDIINLFQIYALHGVHAEIKYTDIADIIHPEGPLYKLIH